jgi:hypothetical protein
MALDARFIFIEGIVLLLFTYFYLEKHLNKEEIFWLFSALSVVLGLFSAYTVITNHPSRENYIPLTVIAIVLSIIYYQTDEQLPPEKG